MPRGTVHLSALMCGAHRAAVLRGIRDGLSGAGDTPAAARDQHPARRGRGRSRFPRGLSRAGGPGLHRPGGRALQSRGRRSAARSLSSSRPSRPPGTAAQGSEPASPRPPRLDWRSPRPRLFEQLLPPALRRDLDDHGIVELLGPGRTLAVDFRTAAENFRLIEDDDTAPVICRTAARRSRRQHRQPHAPAQGRPRTLADAQAPALHRHYPPKRGPAAARPGDIEKFSPAFRATDDCLYDPVLGLVDGSGGPRPRPVSSS